MTFLTCDACGARRWQPALPQVAAMTCLRCGAELAATAVDADAAKERFSRRAEFITHGSGQPRFVLRRASR